MCITSILQPAHLRKLIKGNVLSGRFGTCLLLCRRDHHEVQIIIDINAMEFIHINLLNIPTSFDLPQQTFPHSIVGLIFSSIKITFDLLIISRLKDLWWQSADSVMGMRMFCSGVKITTLCNHSFWCYLSHHFVFILISSMFSSSQAVNSPLFDNLFSCYLCH